MFLKISQNSQENTCAIVSLVIKLQAEAELWHRCFPVNFSKFLRTPFWQNTSFYAEEIADQFFVFLRDYIYPNYLTIPQIDRKYLLAKN